MVDVIKALGIEYVRCESGVELRRVQESIINYGGNRSRSSLPAAHEDPRWRWRTATSKIEGKPMMALLAHGTVGIQHAVDGDLQRLGRSRSDSCHGNMDAGVGKTGVNWRTAAQDMAALMRDSLKWDDEPSSPAEFASSTIRAYRMGQRRPWRRCCSSSTMKCSSARLINRLACPDHDAGFAER